MLVRVETFDMKCLIRPLGVNGMDINRNLDKGERYGNRKILLEHVLEFKYL